MAALDLTGFLAQTAYDDGTGVVDVTALSDAAATLAANNYVYNRLWRIQGDVRKTQVETAVIVNDTLARLQSNIDAGGDANVVTLSKAIKRALENLYKVDFYINLNDPTVAGMFTQAQGFGVLVQAEIDAITAAATYVEKPFTNTTLEQVKAVRNPPLETEATYAGDKVVMGQIKGNSATGGFRFTFTPTEDWVGTFAIRLEAKKDGTESTYTQFPQLPINITGDFKAGVEYSYSYQRTNALTGYRWFKFYGTPMFGTQAFSAEGI